MQARRLANHIEIAVADQGAGISVEGITRVFELFYQEHQGLDREHGGLGLGLTIARSIVEMHGGTIVAQSGGVGLGSTFAVRLPINPEPDHRPET